MKAADAEAFVGIELYATPGDRCEGRAKSTPEDFRVEEVISMGELSTEPSPQLYPLYRVEKRGLDTMRMADEMSRALNSGVSYAGLKDRRAVAFQYVTPTSKKSARPARIDGARFGAELVGFVPRPVSRASVVGNKFEILLRGCCEGAGTLAEAALAAAKERRVPNYYGLQRFGTEGRRTHQIGRALVQGDFEGAAMMLRRHSREGGASAGGIDAEGRVSAALESSPGNWLGALRRVPIRLRRLYVQAYQSFIFNRALSAALRAGEDFSRYQRGDNWASLSEGGLTSSYPHSTKENPLGEATPLFQVPGYAYRDYGSRFDRFVKEAMEDEGVAPGQFYIKEMQELSAEGSFRRPHLALSDSSWRREGDVLSLRFTLARGQYATVLLREILKPLDPAAVGLG